MVVTVLESFAEVATSRNVILPDWDAVADGSRLFHAYCDAIVDYIPKGTGPRWTWELAALSRPSNGSRLPVGQEGLFCSGS